MTELTLTIIVPTFNAGTRLLRAVTSIYRAALPSFEVLVIDDGSSDASLTALRHLYVEQIATRQLRLITTAHKGAGHARNVGLREARGQFVMFIDADDRLLPGVNLKFDFQRSPVDILVYTRTRPRRPLSTGALIDSDLGLQPLVGFSSRVTSKVYRRQFLTAAHLEFPENVQIGEDLVFNLRVLQAAPRVRILAPGIYEWCQNPFSVTHQVNGQQLYQDSLQLVQTLAPLLKSDPQRWSRVIFQRYLMLLVGLSKSTLTAPQSAVLMRRMHTNLVKLLPGVTPMLLSGETAVLPRLVGQLTWRFPAISRWELPVLSWRAHHHEEPVTEII